MNNKRVIIAALTAIVVIAAVVVSQQRAPQTSREKTSLFPELAGKINDVSELVIRDGETTLTVQRVSDRWGIAEADDYPALVDDVKQAVLAVSDLQVVAEKTSNPDLYKRLGVEDPDSLGATSHLLTLKSNGDELARLIVGETRRSKSASSAPGLYVRIPGQQHALLVEGRLSVSADIIQWIKRDIVNIEGDRVSAVHIQPADGQEVSLERAEPGDDLVLQNIPEGKEQQSEYLISRIATILENVYVDAVRREDSFDYSRPDAVINVTTFDGLVADIETVKSGEHTHARFSFSAQPGRADNGETAEEDSTDDEEIRVTPEQEAETLNRLAEGWAYQLSISKAELFNQSLSDLVREPEEEEPEGDSG